MLKPRHEPILNGDELIHLSRLIDLIPFTAEPKQIWEIIQKNFKTPEAQCRAFELIHEYRTGVTYCVEGGAINPDNILEGLNPANVLISKMIRTNKTLITHNTSAIGTAANDEMIDDSDLSKV